jgi:hypothetical protein
MEAQPAKTRITWAAGVAAVVGPACAVLPYTDYLPAAWMRSAFLVICVLAAIAAIFIAIGAFAFYKGSKIAGTICVLTNFPVLAYYGFIIFFAASGGSR